MLSIFTKAPVLSVVLVLGLAAGGAWAGMCAFGTCPSSSDSVAQSSDGEVVLAALSGEEAPADAADSNCNKPCKKGGAKATTVATAEAAPADGSDKDCPHAARAVVADASDKDCHRAHGATTASTTGSDSEKAGGCAGSSCARKAGTFAEADVKAQPDARVGDLVRCPVSGVVFEVTAEHTTVDLEGKTWFSCCAPCGDKLKAEPASFVGGKTAAYPAPAAPVEG